MVTYGRGKEQNEGDFSEYILFYRFDFTNNVYHLCSYKVKFLKSNLKIKNKMKQVNLGLYQIGSTATQRETNPIDLVAHYLTVFP